MKLTPEEQKICDKYSEHINGKVRCFICPLSVAEDNHDFRCRANSHWSEKEDDWVLDAWKEK